MWSHVCVRRHPFLFLFPFFIYLYTLVFFNRGAVLFPFLLSFFFFSFFSFLTLITIPASWAKLSDRVVVRENGWLLEGDLNERESEMFRT
jgi:hypothetical protein